MTNSQAPMQSSEVRVYPIFTVRWLAFLALAIPSVFFLGSIQLCNSWPVKVINYASKRKS